MTIDEIRLAWAGVDVDWDMEDGTDGWRIELDHDGHDIVATGMTFEMAKRLVDAPAHTLYLLCVIDAMLDMGEQETPCPVDAPCDDATDCRDCWREWAEGVANG